MKNKKYKIIIEEINIVSGKNYPDKEEIYTQTVTNIDLNRIIYAINDIPEKVISIESKESRKARINFWKKASDYQKGLIKNLEKNGFKIIL